MKSNCEVIGPMSLETRIERWPLRTPFRIAGYTFEEVEVLHILLKKDDQEGQSEAAGVYYRNDKPTLMREQVEALRPSIEAGISREALQLLLPAGGARNGLDCALWDLEAQLTGSPAWQRAGIETPRPLLTTFTCGADTPEKMAQAALAYSNARAIKLKLTGEPIDADRVFAVRGSLPDVWLAVDANQGFSRASLDRLMPTLLQNKVQLIEQPFPIGQEVLLDGYRSPIRIAADESVQGLADVGALANRFDVVNIKLDKCGGLTEGLAMARAAHELGLDTMVGNMMGTSLAMAPAYLIGQLCQVVDLDGPAFIKNDRNPPVQYDDGYVICPQALWGHVRTSE